MKTTIILITIFILTSCNLKKHYMEERPGNLYATQEGDNYPYIVDSVYWHNCSGYYVYEIRGDGVAYVFKGKII